MQQLRVPRASQFEYNISKNAAETTVRLVRDTHGVILSASLPEPQTMSLRNKHCRLWESMQQTGDLLPRVGVFSEANRLYWRFQLGIDYGCDQRAGLTRHNRRLFF